MVDLGMNISQKHSKVTNAPERLKVWYCDAGLVASLDRTFSKMLRWYSNNELWALPRDNIFFKMQELSLHDMWSQQDGVFFSTHYCTNYHSKNFEYKSFWAFPLCASMLPKNNLCVTELYCLGAISRLSKYRCFITEFSYFSQPLHIPL